MEKHTFFKIKGETALFIRAFGNKRVIEFQVSYYKKL